MSETGGSWGYRGMSGGRKISVIYSEICRRKLERWDFCIPCVSSNNNMTLLSFLKNYVRFSAKVKLACFIGYRPDVKNSESPGARSKVARYLLWYWMCITAARWTFDVKIVCTGALKIRNIKSWCVKCHRTQPEIWLDPHKLLCMLTEWSTPYFPFNAVDKLFHLTSTLRTPAFYVTQNDNINKGSFCRKERETKVFLNAPQCLWTLLGSYRWTVYNSRSDSQIAQLLRESDHGPKYSE